MNIPNTISSSSIKYIQIFLDVSDTGYLLFKKLLIFLFFMVKQNTPKKKKILSGVNQKQLKSRYYAVKCRSSLVRIIYSLQEQTILKP